ncbi:MAG: hypothetical protein EOP37_10710 [Rubrivivax sp.]|nr:MAG: hypothetical protein EOP37_10710 [Rubrivivax sp.]
MRHDDAIYLRWLRAASRCRSLSHQLYMLMNAGARPPDHLIDQFKCAIDDAHASSNGYLGHLREVVRHVD